MLNDLNPSDYAAIYIVCGFTDMRCGINTLSAMIESRFHMPPFRTKTLYLFCGKNSHLLKGIIWEGDGFLMLTKRLESGHFSWPRNSSEVRAMTPEQFRWLMQGFSIDPPIKIVNPEHCA